jgi:hypothetical protein
MASLLLSSFRFEGVKVVIQGQTGVVQELEAQELVFGDGAVDVQGAGFKADGVAFGEFAEAVEPAVQFVAQLTASGVEAHIIGHISVISEPRGAYLRL